MVVPFTCVAAEISKLLLWESLAANALVVNARASVANMILENNEDFITAPLILSRNCVGNRLGAAFFHQRRTLQFFADDLQFLAWVKKQARVCVPISGDCSRLGPPKPWARTFPEPRESQLLAFNSCRPLYFFSTCKDDAKQPKVSTNLLKYCFLDDKWSCALAFTRPTRSLFTFSEQLVPRRSVRK